MNRFAALGLVVEALDGKRIAVVVPEEADVTLTLNAALDAAAAFAGDVELTVEAENGRQEIATPNDGRLLFMSPRLTKTRLRGWELTSIYLERYATVDPDTLAGLYLTGTTVINA
ncbi:hypothetical protein J2X03_003794 [Microbacterium trichothecenolyticum]|uniref:hypothetical protein n=1 Tax=Microbacterium trichothecenolyticum TaxID=69370 RepID=UPI0028670283|nr:hypothetical protein [Microbacterium trichothecenolyticum]MDR7113892.1 hypothetical protein [Microbacterium trichothecenolyticum]